VHLDLKKRLESTAISGQFLLNKYI
jgi:hypothetical protein